MMAKPVLILSCGPVHKRYRLESFAEMFVKAGKLREGSYEVVDVTHRHPPWPIAGYGGAILTGSLAMVTDGQRWVERLAAWIVQAAQEEFPLLGVCFGHQAMAHALGGTVGYHPESSIFGTFDLNLHPAAKSTILKNLPPVFPAQLSHAQVVLEPPPEAEVLAGHDHDPYCALKYGHGQLSVQFHPEFDLRIMEAFLKKTDVNSPPKAAPNRPAQKLLFAPLRPSPEAGKVVADFLAVHAGLGPTSIRRPARTQAAAGQPEPFSGASPLLAGKK
jgi:GMP synthase (glutamine-hydrolysing)